MKRLFKWAMRLVLAAVLVLVLLFVFRNSILRVIVEHRIRAQTGMEAQIGHFSSGLLTPVVTIQHLKLYNTPEFGGRLFLDVPELHFELDPDAMSRRKLHVILIRFDLAELDIVRNEVGQTNIVSLAKKLQAAKPDDLMSMLGQFEFAGVDVLNLTLGKTKYVDLANPRNNREVNVNLQDQVFRHVKSEADLNAVLFLVWLRTGMNFGADLSHSPPPSPLEKPVSKH